MEDASVIANSITLANLRGADSHGILRVPIYIKRLRKGLVNKSSEFSIETDSPALAICDAHNTMGQVAGRKGMKVAMEKAKQMGIGMAVVKNSNHFGVAAEYSLMAVEEGMFGISMSNATPLMAPTGGLGKAIGNNPLALAFPNGDVPVAVDMAMTTVALGKVLSKASNREPVPVGWGVDKNGVDTTDPNAITNGGYLLPLGGPKGYALAVAVEILTGVLAGSAVCKEVLSLQNMEEPLYITHTFIAIDYGRFIPEPAYKERMAKMEGFLRNCQLLEGTDRIYLPGEIEEQTHKQRLEQGIQISGDLKSELLQLAEELNIQPLQLA